MVIDGKESTRARDTLSMKNQSSRSTVQKTEWGGFHERRLLRSLSRAYRERFIHHHLERKRFQDRCKELDDDMVGKERTWSHA